VLTLSPPVPKAPDEPAPSPARETQELSRLRSALAVLPNNDLDYDSWAHIIFAIHHESGGSDEGHDLAHEWSAKSSKHNAEFLDAEVWPYLRSDRERPITGATIYTKATAAGWQDPEVLAGFDVVSPANDPFAATPPAKIDRYRRVTYTELASRPPLQWWVKGVVPKADLMVIYGESGSGKSFFALDLFGAIARGVEWQGRRVQQAKVVYLAAEGQHGIANRVAAYIHKHDIAPADFAIDMIVNAPNLLTTEDTKAVIDVLKDGGCGILIVDTLARVTPGADENAGKDMGKVLAHCARISEALGCLVVLIHHAGKDASKGARGWSGVRAAVDTEIEVGRIDDDRWVRVTKQKDGRDGDEWGFRLAMVPVGVDEDGDVYESCVVEWTGNGRVVKRARPPGEHQRRVLRALQDAAGLGGGGADREAVLDAVVDDLVPPGEGKRDTRRQVATRALQTLLDDGALVCKDGRVMYSNQGDENE
jgi:KaiC/GvpD/RAD55 family RecA-like ATPase